MDQLLGINEPPDGFTDEEKVLVRLMGEHTIESLYGKLPTSRMKAIVALHFELGYSQELIGRMFRISQERVNQEVDNVRKILMGQKFKPHKEKVTISVPDLIKLCHTLLKP